MSKSTSIRFFPASSKDFTTAAKDLAEAYGLNLSRAQEILSRIYGYENYHELQQILKKGPEAGPYAGDADAVIASARISRPLAFLKDEYGRPLFKVGWADYADLHLYSRPHERREFMRYKRRVDQELDPNHHSVSNLQASDYIEFSVRRDDWERSSEGIFYITEQGKIVHDALRYLEEVGHSISSVEQFDEHLDLLENIIKNHPANPFPIAAYLSEHISHTEYFDLWHEVLAGEEDLDEEDRAVTEMFVERAGKCIRLFNSVMPSSFRGRIEPKLAAFGTPLDNWPYMSTLYYGGVAALALGETTKGQRWLKKCWKHNKRDDFGVSSYLNDEQPIREN